MSLIPIIPFLVFGRFQMDWDAWFHLSRIYEIVNNIKYGKIFPDISYFTFNKQGYAVNFFYPYFANYPIALLLLIIKKPILTLIIFNVIFHTVGLNIAYHVYYKLKKSLYFSFLFSILYIFGYTDFNTRLLNMGTYNQQIAYIFLPLAIIGIYQTLLGDAKKWRYELVIGIVLITLTHLLTTYLLIIYAVILFTYLVLFKRRLITKTRSITWGHSIVEIILSTLIFTVPLLQQKFANDWLKVPALNLGSSGILSNSASKVSWWQRLSDGFSFQDIIIVLFLIMIIVAATYKLFDNDTKIILIGIVVVGIMQSNLIPYYFLQRLSFIDMIQNLSRFDVFLYFLIALFISNIAQNYHNSKKKRKNNASVFILCLYLIFCSQNFNLEKNIFTGNMTSFDISSYYATNDNIIKGLSNSNFGYFGPDAGKGYYRVNGFMDYRTSQQIKRIPNEKGGYDIDSGSYPIENQKSFAPVINLPPTYQVSSNDFIENAVYFDNQRTFGHYKQDKFRFVINDIPEKTKKIRTSITYLNGFKASNDKGEELKSYKDKDGWLVIENRDNSEIMITYEKTPGHKIAIVISIVTWLVISLSILVSSVKNKYRKKS